MTTTQTVKRKLKIPFIKPGKAKSLSGKVVEFSEADMDTILSATSKRTYQNDEIPIVIGHPKTDSPAWGWVNKKNIEKVDNILIAFADEENLVKEFVPILEKKLFKTISVSLRDDYSIKHFGILGATPPAITGLPALSFSEDTAETFEFAEYEFSKWWFRSLGRILRTIKNKMIEDKGTEAADKFINEYDLEEISNPPAFYEKQTLRSFSETEIENNLNTNLSEEEMKELDDLKNQVTALTAKVTGYETEIATLKNEKGVALSEAQQLKLDQKRKTFVAFCEGDDVKNKIKDGEKDSIVEAMLAMDALQVIELGEGDQKKSVNVLNVFKSTIKNLKDVVELGEHATNSTTANQVENDTEFAEMNVDQDRLALHNKAKAKSKAENITYEAALKLIK